jgi:hypothetical protein
MFVGVAEHVAAVPEPAVDEGEACAPCPPAQASDHRAGLRQAPPPTGHRQERRDPFTNNALILHNLSAFFLVFFI